MSVGVEQGRPASRYHERPAARRLRALSFVAAVCLSGCYEYVAPEGASPMTGREIQLSLTDSGTTTLAAVVGPWAESVSGKIVEERDSAFVLAVERVRLRGGQEVRWRGERVTIDRLLTARAGERVFSPIRTALFSGLVGTALLVARNACAGHGSGGGGAGVGQSGSPR